MPKADVGIALYVLAAFVMFIISVPSWLLDVLLALNISIAFTILFTCMFIKEVLDISYFPTILLFTTIFRIALNVSSTRLILTEGGAGKVIEVFGSFVGGGDLIVGAIVYVILIIVQLMVINKGSERVEAKERRQKIQDEASFFGAMDGATKYVKGDATAGLIITAVNLLGGIAMGILRKGMDVNTAINTYSILTMGDGLVSSIPSLMISMSTGILVTKGSKEADFGHVLIGQLFGMPKTLYLVGGVLTGLGIASPLPTLLYVAFGAGFILLGRVAS